MNFSQAKQIPITDYLMQRGVRPHHVDGGKVWWYCSPLRSESTPSFKVDINRNVWYDHGIGDGGTIIDLVEALDGVTANQALHRLGNVEPLSAEESFAFHQQLSIDTGQRESKVRIKSVKLLNNPALIKYAESRKIPFEIARTYLKECYYSVGEKSFFALGFANDLGGYELRNSLWQGASSPKAITTLPLPGASTIAVFEGFFDMLSALVYFGKSKPAHSVLVLNSIALLDAALPTLRQYERVNLFLDSDDPGQKATKSIQEVCTNAVDYSVTYYPKALGKKDFNELLTKPAKQVKDNAN